MSPEESTELPSIQRDATRIVNLGEWLFRHRTITAVPLALAILALPPAASTPSHTWLVFGAALVATGEGVRLWSVRHIGVISRTRSERLGPLIASGPFALVRNPLYLGNIMLWMGFALSARLLWLAPIIVLVLGLEYHAIVRWEERLLESRLGATYLQYVSSVSRWIPGRASRTPEPAAPSHPWRETLFSERGTLIAIAIGSLLLWLKSQV